MAETPNLKMRATLPDTSSQTVRQRWLGLFELSYTARRVAQEEIEPGVYAVVVPAACRKETSRDLIDVEVRVASSRVPPMGRGVRLPLETLGEFSLTLPADYQGWMGAWGKDIAAGDTLVTAFVDLAYLEAALLARLWDHGVIVEFGSPLAFFRRGALSDYANVYEATVAMLVHGRSIADTADEMAAHILARLQLYANAFHQLSSLYTQAAWHIDRDTFVAKSLGSGLPLALQYWELRGDHPSEQKVLHRWRHRIESFVHESVSNPGDAFPKSFAA